MLTVTSLFSGIGGIDLGLEMTGHFKTELFSELDPFCQKVLKKHWPNVPIIPDVRDIDGKEIRSDVIVGGFPCQPFSVAGKQKGKNDERHLWPEMFRIIKDAKPSIVIGENVPGLINVQMALGACISDLESEGYEVQPFILPASAINAPHRRYRVFIIAMANPNSNDRRSRSSSKPQNRKTWMEHRSSCTRQFIKEPYKDVAHTNSLGSHDTIRNSFEKSLFEKQERQKRAFNIIGSSEVSSTQTNVANSKSSNRYDNEVIREHGKITTQKIFGNRSSFSRESSWFSSEPNVGRVANGVSDRVDRIKSLGNAVVPQLAYAIGQCIIQAIKQERE
tara:strand:- start:529 stop:1530 length:1002 start_codon:yes stop_codon:yes gene_type:complete